MSNNFEGHSASSFVYVEDIIGWYNREGIDYPVSGDSTTIFRGEDF